MSRGRASNFCALLIVTALAGCQRYDPQPLSDAAVADRLRAPADEALRVPAASLHHPLLAPIQLHPADGLTPDEAAVVAVLINPNLRAARNARGTAAAALLQAGLLPNPTLGYSSDFTNASGFTQGTFNTYGVTVSWDFEQLLSHGAKVNAAELSAASVDLSVAWQEWQTAEGAKQAVLDLISLKAQLAVLAEIDDRLRSNLEVVQRAEGAGLQTAVDLAAADAAARDAHGAVLQAQRDVDHQWFALTRALGLPPEARPKLRGGLTLPSSFTAPDGNSLATDLGNHRIDLVALRRGYDSQEQTLRAAVIDQFPKVNLGFNDASDNSNIHSVGLVATIDLPIFDRNQGAIAAERATRQRLFDEYVARVFEARSDIAIALADLRALTGQVADAEAAVPNLQRLVTPTSGRSTTATRMC